MATEQTFDPHTHNGYITVFNPKTGGHATYWIHTENWGTDEVPRYQRVVYLLRGPDRDNFEHWTPFAFADLENGVCLWRKLRGTKYEKHAAVLNDIDAGFNYGLEYVFEGRCRKCNRKLTNPVAVKLGIGPKCGGHGNAKSALPAEEAA